MDAKCCDRCGEFYKTYYMRLTKSGTGFNAIRLINESNSQTFDLCPNCMSDLQKWLKEPGLIANENKD